MDRQVERCTVRAPYDRCEVCGSRARSGFSDCYCCHVVRRQLGLPLAPIVTIADYRVGDPLHHLLRGYKDGPSAAIRSLRAHAIADRVADWLARNVEAGRASHASHIGSVGRWDVVTVVPSVRRPGAPAEAIILLVPELSGRYQPVLTRGPALTDHLRADRHGFATRPGVQLDRPRQSRVLIFDDSLTTGARAQSAAFAVRRAGGLVVGVLAVGRARRAEGGPELLH